MENYCGYIKLVCRHPKQQSHLNICRTPFKGQDLYINKHYNDEQHRPVRRSNPCRQGLQPRMAFTTDTIPRQRHACHQRLQDQQDLQLRLRSQQEHDRSRPTHQLPKQTQKLASTRYMVLLRAATASSMQEVLLRMMLGRRLDPLQRHQRRHHQRRHKRLNIRECSQRSRDTVNERYSGDFLLINYP